MNIEFHIFQRYRIVYVKTPYDNISTLIIP